MKYPQIPKHWHKSGPTLITVVEINHLFRIGHDYGRQADVVPFCFYKLLDAHGKGVGCFSCHRLFSHKDNTVGYATDVPPFSSLIIQCDGQIKIGRPNIATQDSSSPVIVILVKRYVAEGQKPSQILTG